MKVYEVTIKSIVIAADGEAPPDCWDFETLLKEFGLHQNMVTDITACELRTRGGWSKEDFLKGFKARAKKRNEVKS